ncbi:hypothetical protein LSTR_LSTR014916 [Laodelphax striatellus]|uniref:Uncharacterized protein n=1 Tax=Laodelphax striatellus TaxID=195883 RepID=A0A482WX73_LAOST|nr:hypothetical protein LSTR_LSTR014916 [Laodelphax striatellus]
MYQRPTELRRANSERHPMLLLRRPATRDARRQRHPGASSRLLQCPGPARLRQNSALHGSSTTQQHSPTG